MGRFGWQYSTIVSVTGGLFLTFVACGSQLYRVSLHGDSGSRPVQAGGASGGSSKTTESNSSRNPSSTFYAIHAPGGWVEKPVHYKFDPRMSKDQKAAIQTAMSTWEAAVGKLIFAYDGTQTEVTGDTFPDLYSSLDDGINGLYLDNNWEKTGKDKVVLATTIWDNDSGKGDQIQTADMRYNNANYLFGDSMILWPEDGREVVDLQTVATHELGHFLGLNHVDAKVDADSIMVPALYIGQGITQRTISTGDIRRIQKVYGCTGDSCDLERTHAKIAEMVRLSH